jgi:hypothetical protein
MRVYAPVITILSGLSHELVVVLRNSQQLQQVVMSALDRTLLEEIRKVR